jgi:5-methylcytosine-specific restriction enzyme subunit McrC
MTRVEMKENGEWASASFDVSLLEGVCSTGLLEYRLVAGGAQLKPRINRVGAVSIGQHEFVVQPKASFSSVLFMLGYARDPGFQVDEISGTGSELFPVLAETLARFAERALGGGVLQGYRSYDETAVTVRGRVRFSDQMARRGSQLLPVELTYDEFTVDIAENQILRAAAQLLLGIPGVDARIRRRLTHVESRLEGVSLLRRGAELPTWTPTRLNARYHSALRFAELVIAGLTPSSLGSGERIASFVVDLSEAFEGFVAKALSEAYAGTSTGVSRGQYSMYLDDERRQLVRPDFVHLVGGRPQVVVDAKYKLGDPRVADLYQMLAYCSVLGLRSGTLIYISDGQQDADRLASVRGTSVVVRTARVDVSAPPKQMIDRLHGIARESLLRARVSESTNR